MHGPMIVESKKKKGMERITWATYRVVRCSNVDANADKTFCIREVVSKGPRRDNGENSTYQQPNRPKFHQKSPFESRVEQEVVKKVLSIQKEVRYHPKDITTCRLTRTTKRASIRLEECMSSSVYCIAKPGPLVRRNSTHSHRLRRIHGAYPSF